MYYIIVWGQLKPDPVSLLEDLFVACVVFLFLVSFFFVCLTYSPFPFPILLFYRCYVGIKKRNRDYLLFLYAVMRNYGQRWRSCNTILVFFYVLIKCQYIWVDVFWLLFLRGNFVPLNFEMDSFALLLNMYLS